MGLISVTFKGRCEQESDGTWKATVVIYADEQEFKTYERQGFASEEEAKKSIAQAIKVCEQRYAQSLH